LTDNEEIEPEDPMDVLNRCYTAIWDECPYANPHLLLKVRTVAHNQTTEVLTLLKKKVDLASTFYKATYLDIFKALITKRITSKKTDTDGHAVLDRHRRICDVGHGDTVMPA
jgi:hypothetical protein